MQYLTNVWRYSVTLATDRSRVQISPCVYCTALGKPLMDMYPPLLLTFLF